MLRHTAKSAERKENVVLGQELRKLRLKAGLTQRELGPMLGRHHSFVGRVEAAETLIDIATLIDYINFIGGDPVEVFRYVVESVPAESAKHRPR